MIRSSMVLSRAIQQSGVANQRSLQGPESPIEILSRLVTVESLDKQDVIRVSTEAEFPSDAARIANAVVRAYIEYQSDTVNEMVQSVKREKLSREQGLSQMRAKLLKLRQRNHSLNFRQDQGNIIFQRLSRLADAVMNAEMAMVNAKFAHDLAKSGSADPEKTRQALWALRENISYEELRREQDLRQEVASLRNQLRELSLHYQPDHPAIAPVKKELAEAKRKLELQKEEIGRIYRTLVRQRYELARKKLSDLQAAFADQQAKAMELNARAAEYALLKSDVERTEKLVQTLNDRLDQMGVSPGDNGVLNFRVLEDARPARKPSSPDVVRVGVVSVLAGLSLGLLVAFVMDWTDPRFRTEQEVSLQLGLPILGTVPTIEGKAREKRIAQTVVVDPPSAAAEGYRVIRTGVYFATGRGDFRSILITSSAPGEGKSTLASNLALTMAEAGMRVLVIDADRYRPVQHEHFQLEPEDERRINQRSLESLLIRRTDRDNVDVLPNGPLLQAALGALGKEPWTYLLERIGREYDRVVVDAPPTLPMADSISLAASCDVTLMVIRRDRTPAKVATLAVETLRQVGANLLGVVLNAVESHGNYYGYALGHYAHYFRASESQEDPTGRAGRRSDNGPQFSRRSSGKDLAHSQASTTRPG
jgi:capsular exopolysaccharide synthesis family protein